MRTHFYPAHAQVRSSLHHSSRPQLRAVARAAVDRFEGSPAIRSKEPAQPAKVDAPLEKSIEALLGKVVTMLGELLTKLTGGQAAAPATPTAKPAAPSAPGLEPTPINPNVEGQQAKVNTIQDPHVAPKSQFRAAVNAAIDRVREQGIGIDPNDRDAITDFDKYHSAVVTELRRGGYNAAYDGEELAIGRKGDDFSEQFDISTSTGRTRRFYASWVSPPVWA